MCVQSLYIRREALREEESWLLCDLLLYATCSSLKESEEITTSAGSQAIGILFLVRFTTVHFIFRDAPFDPNTWGRVLGLSLHAEMSFDRFLLCWRNDALGKSLP